MIYYVTVWDRAFVVSIKCTVRFIYFTFINYTGVCVFGMLGQPPTPICLFK